MSDYIKREDALNKLSRIIDYCQNDNKVSALTALFQVGDMLMDCKAADVAEVRYGYWSWCGGNLHRCTACNTKTHVDECMGEPIYEYCPYCGTLMQEVEHEAD